MVASISRGFSGMCPRRVRVEHPRGHVAVVPEHPTSVRCEFRGISRTRLWTSLYGARDGNRNGGCISRYSPSALAKAVSTHTNQSNDHVHRYRSYHSGKHTYLFVGVLNEKYVSVNNPRSPLPVQLVRVRHSLHCPFNRSACSCTCECDDPDVNDTNVK